MSFARVDGAAIAHQTFGAGDVDVFVIPPFAQNIELTWERPEFCSFFSRMGRFARVLHFDKRGTGASDRTDRMPTIDQRVEDAIAVMDAAGLSRAHVVGISEGGAVAIALAATYPERVETLALFASAARIVGDETDEEREARRAGFRFFQERWGTDRSVTLDVFAPSMASDPGYRTWEPRYERQSATPAAVAELLEMAEAIDVRPLLGAVTVPTLIIHRRDDGVIPVTLARETAALLPHARFVELDGVDHFAHVGDIDPWLDEYERFVCGTVSSPVADPSKPEIRVDVLGGFRVTVDGRAVPSAAWGSRQARTVCKRLAVAVGGPVTREELADLLWPDELDAARRGARLSVVLSNIRRVLGGGLVADRDVVRLDLDAVDLDLVALDRAIAGGDDATAVAAHTGPVLPDEPYEDWAVAARRRYGTAVAGARRRLASEAAQHERWDEVAEHAVAMLADDDFDERAHELLVGALLRSGRRGEAIAAHSRYVSCMAELGVRPRDLLAEES
ncbi:MAG TPA: alpha/beta fold hydrolase [Acidimicrobiales bacterium]|nr:alpha/beta fold hydrolase [Acidimicrobiales bacterium]